MRKFLFLIVVLIANITIVCAQYNNPGISFAKIPGWNKEYLTIMSGGRISAEAKYVDYILDLVGRNGKYDTKRDGNYYYYQVINCPDDIVTPLGSVILKIDGVDAKNMSEQQASRLLCEEGSHKLLLQNTDNKVYEATIFDTPRPIWLQAYGFDPRMAEWEKCETGNRDRLTDNIKVRIDNDAPWSKFKSYDYDITSDDVLEEKELLEKVCARLEMYGLYRDVKNPDILVTIAKNADMSIEYVYVPEEEHAVVTGSESTTRYSSSGRYKYTDTKNKIRTYSTGGYTHKQATSSFYFEIDILEASKIGQKTLPLIQQIKCQYTSDREENFEKLYDRVIDEYKFPIISDAVLYKSESCQRCMFLDDDDCIYFIEFGIVVNDNRVVCGIDESSSVVTKSGIRVGDKIERVEMERSVRTGWLYSGTGAKWNYSGSIYVERDGALKELKFKDATLVDVYNVIFYQYR